MIKWNDNKWNDGQLSAINASDCSVIVSAAAGSGKTSVLVERLLRIIADREKNIPVERMVVVTFTRDAAAEMKQRLSDALTSLIEQYPNDRWLSRQNSMLGCAMISTISSFCLELLRRNISLLPFSSEFRIADDAEHKILMMQAFKETIDDYYENKNDEIITLRQNFCRTDDSPFERMVYDIYDKISSVPFFDEWLEEAVKKYDTGAYEDYVAKSFMSTVESCKEVLKKAVWHADILGNEKVSELINNENKGFETAFESLEQKKYMDFRKAILSITFSRFPNAKKTDDLAVREVVAKCRKLYKKYWEILERNSALFAYANEDNIKGKEIFLLVCDFIKSFKSNLMAIKEKKNAISFDDIEHLTLGILSEKSDDGKIVKTDLAKELSEYYELIMIDEFQDTNNRQDMIFRLLSRNGSADMYGENLFFVGDVKQSIYRFRLANPDIFINAMKDAVPYKKDVHESSYIKLNKNYRSSDEVINLSNYVFSCIMSEKVGDIRYNEDEYLYRGASFCEAEREPVVMMFDASEGDKAEAKCVARKISEMLGKDVVSVYKDGKVESRKCEMKDFCILMRGNANIPVYAKELENLGISVCGNSEKGYFKSREISVLINLLRVTDNPLLDVPLMSVMLSPMMMFTADEAAQVRLLDREKSIYSNLCKGIGVTGEQPIFEGILLKKSLALHALITELRLYTCTNTIQELVRTIYESTDFMSVMQLYDSSGRKKANLQMMFEYVGNYEKNFDGGLSGFIRYIDRVMESDTDFEMASTSSGIHNAVTIKNMHKSKGLEFPFVFIVGTDTKFNKMDSSKPFQFSYDMGIGFRLQNPERHESYATLSYEAINMKNKLSSISEEMRLLYVAMTRAKERLFITLNCEEKRVKKALEFAQTIYDEGSITPDISASANSMGDWILMCLLSHSKSAYLRERFGIFESFRYNNDFNIKYEECFGICDIDNEVYDSTGIVNKVEVSEEKVEKLKNMFDFSYDTSLSQLAERISVSDMISEYEEYANAYDESSETEVKREYVEKLREMFEFDYDASLSQLTAKLTVSDVTKDDGEFEVPLKRPVFVSETGSMTSAEKGTALHTFMQFVDFDALEKDFDKELERLYNFGYLSKKQKSVIKKEDAQAFINSNLYKRMKECKEVQRERKFLIAIDELGIEGRIGEEYRGTSGMLNGIIDMVLEFEDYFIIVDYKTDRVSDESELVSRYSKQLKLYKNALEKIETKPVKETLIYSFYQKKELVVN